MVCDCYMHIDTMSIPAKDYRGIKDPTATFELWVFRSGSDALPLLSFPARGLVLLFLRFAARVLPPGIAAAHCLQVRHRAAHVPSVSRLYVACVLRQSKGIRSRVSRLRDKDGVCRFVQKLAS